jgi:hypothetical protein
MDVPSHDPYFLATTWKKRASSINDNGFS